MRVGRRLISCEKKTGGVESQESEEVQADRRISGARGEGGKMKEEIAESGGSSEGNWLNLW